MKHIEVAAAVIRKGGRIFLSPKNKVRTIRVIRVRKRSLAQPVFMVLVSMTFEPSSWWKEKILSLERTKKNGVFFGSLLAYLYLCSAYESATANGFTSFAEA